VERPAATAEQAPSLVESSVSVPEEPVYLDDLREKSYSGVRRLGKHGWNNQGQPFTWQGEQPSHALFAHPPYTGASDVVYELQGEYDRFLVTAALADSVTNRSSVPLVFRIVGDGQTLRESQKLQYLGDFRNFNVSLRGVRELRLQVECPGNNGQAHAVWINPRLYRASAQSIASTDNGDGAEVPPKKKRRKRESP
jgi:hypothetical protein